MSARPEPVTYGDRAVFTVSDFNQGVAGWLARLGNVWVEGEISELTPRARMVFFCLKDERDGSVLQAWIERDRFAKVEPAPAVGDRLHAYGRGELWRKRGEFRFRAFALEQFGLGQLLKRIEELRVRLAAEGLFAEERKRPLPLLPRVVGLVCGADAAAKRDVVETAERRYPPVRFHIVEATVQGRAAPASVAAALAKLDADPAVDVIVLARGGGSPEDLLPFSDEAICRAVAECTTPVVSAIGHEQDSPLVDLVADARAGTPSLAARMVVPDHAALAESLDALLRRGARALEGGAAQVRRTLELLVSRPAFARPETWIEVRRAALASAGDRLAHLPALRIERESARVEALHGRLRVLGPAATLDRGYAIVQNESGAVVRESGAVSVDDRVGVRLARGRLVARVEETAE
jgi:exodeoxyribonuclease VII large subunit